MSRRKHFHLRAVGFIEGKEWGAMCLETGYLGYGPTFEAALVDLVEATRAAIACVRRQGWPDDAIFNGGPVPRRFVAMYERAIQSAARPSAVFQVAA
jgi:hypothetical protein